MDINYRMFQYVTLVLSDGTEAAFMGPALVGEDDRRTIAAVRVCPPRSLESEMGAAADAKYRPEIIYAQCAACTQSVKLGASVLPDDIKLKD